MKDNRKMLVTNTTAHEGGGLAGALPFSTDKDYADTEVVANFIRLEIVGLLMQKENERISMEDEWRETDKVVRNMHGQGRAYFGNSEVSIPAGHNILTGLASNIRQGLFPSNDYIAATALMEGIDEQAKAQELYMRYEFDIQARIRAKAIKIIWNYVKHGNAPIKVSYQETAERPALKNIRSHLAAFAQQGSESRPYDGLRVKDVNPYNFYVYPETVDDLNEASVVWETFDMTGLDIEEMSRLDGWSKKATEHLMRGAGEMSEARRRDRLAKSDLGLSTDNESYVGTTYGIVCTIKEVWTKMVLPKDAYADTETPGEFVPVRIVLSGDHILSVRRNPLAHQLSPYELWTKRPDSGAIWGVGYGKLIQGLQALVNDTANQVNDVGTFSLNPIGLVDPDLVPGPLAPMRPGRMYKGKKGGLEFFAPPMHQVQYGHEHLNAILSYLQDFTGSPPVSQGLKAATTATATQTLQRNASVPIQDEVEMGELTAMNNILRKGYLLCQQYRTTDMQIPVPGGPPLQFRPEFFLAEIILEWLASGQAQSHAQKMMQTMQFISMVMNPASLQLLNQQGFSLNLSALLRDVWNQGMSRRGFENYITKLDPTQQRQVQQQQASGQGPGIAPQQMEDVRTALSQTPTGSPDAAPGEGEGAFQEVAKNGDGLAAQLGFLGGT